MRIPRAGPANRLDASSAMHKRNHTLIHVCVEVLIKEAMNAKPTQSATIRQGVNAQLQRLEILRLFDEKMKVRPA